MHRSRRLLASLTLLLGIVPAGASHAQAIIDTPKSRIELIGLHRWSLRMIEDSLAVYAPKDSLTGHACAAILRGKLHFADASVNVFFGYPELGNRNYVAITVVEPQDSTRIHYKGFVYDSLPARPEFAEAFKTMRGKELAQRAIQTVSFYAPALTHDDSATFASVLSLHDLLSQHRSDADFADARRTLATDRAYANRVAAAIVLANFGDREETWYALVDALRDPVGMVSSTAGQILKTLTKRSPRSVDWAPMASELRYIVDGTNLFGFDVAIGALTATRIDPAMAPGLLAGGGDIVRAKLQSNAPGVKDGATAFLAQLSGLPSTSAPDEFVRWMNALPR